MCPLRALLSTRPRGTALSHFAFGARWTVTTRGTHSAGQSFGAWGSGEPHGASRTRRPVCTRGAACSWRPIQAYRPSCTLRATCSSWSHRSRRSNSTNLTFGSWGAACSGGTFGAEGAVCARKTFCPGGSSCSCNPLGTQTALGPRRSACPVRSRCALFALCPRGTCHTLWPTGSRRAGASRIPLRSRRSSRSLRS